MTTDNELDETNEEDEVEEIHSYEKQLCPECNSINFIHVEGCDICLNCGWSTCILN